MVFSDEIYDQMTYDGVESIPMATLVRDTVCCTMSGLSKIYRACGYRVGWAAFSGNLRGAGDYLSALELLTSLRLCSNVPAQWAVQTALGGYQSIKELLAPGGRLYESRRAILEATSGEPLPALAPPKGSMYAFVRVKTEELPGLRRSDVRARPARAEARAARARHQLQRAVSRSLPHHAAAGCGAAQEGVRAHRRTAYLVRQPSAGGAPRVVHAESRFK